jgi:hypothetical protein
MKRFQLPPRPSEPDVLLAGLQEAIDAASVPPNATQKERGRIFAACQAAARRKWNDAEAAWKIACDEARVAARAEVETLRARAQAIRAEAAKQAHAIDVEAAEIEASIA